jgi:hypothetical protein
LKWNNKLLFSQLIWIRLDWHPTEDRNALTRHNEKKSYVISFKSKMIMKTLPICIVFLVAFRISVIFSQSRKRIHTEIATLPVFFEGSMTSDFFTLAKEKWCVVGLAFVMNTTCAALNYVPVRVAISVWILFVTRFYAYL